MTKHSPIGSRCARPRVNAVDSIAIDRLGAGWTTGGLIGLAVANVALVAPLLRFARRGFEPERIAAPPS